MASSSWKIRLKDLKEQSEQISSAYKNFSSSQDFLSKSETVKDCIVRLQSFSETASKVPADIRKELNSIPWRELRDLKKRLTGRSSKIPSVTWHTIQNTIPKMQSDLTEILVRLDTPAHPWRICPPGETYVRKAKISSYLTKGFPVIEHMRRDHCREIDDSAKNTLTLQEVQDIAEIFFPALTGLPAAHELGAGIKGTQYDAFIRGWTKYWNDVFKPEPTLDADAVKALIFSESSFNPDAGKGKRGGAKGLMQLMPITLKALQGYRNELKDHLFEFNESDIYEPSLHISAGIRWLFQKRITASRRLKRQATWDEAVEDYKDYLRRRPKKSPNIPHPQMKNYQDSLQKLKTF